LIDEISLSYPLSFIDNPLSKFFFEYISSSSSTFLPFIDDEKQYFLMHNKIMSQLTAQQSQLPINATAADIDNDQTDNTEEEIKTTEPATKHPIKPETMEINKLFIIHMKPVLKHLNKICIKFMKIFSKILSQWMLN
jgi:hypothetical protein